MVSICAAYLAALTTVLAAPLTEQEKNDYIARYIAQQNQTHTFQAELRQTLRLRGLKNPVESVGHIYYKAPDSLAMIFTQPAGEFLLLMGDDMYMKKAKKPLQHHRAQDARGGHNQNAGLLLSLFKSDAADYNRLFTIQIARTNEDLLVTLVPKDRDAKLGFSAIDNIVALPTLDVRSTRISFDKDNSLTYEFLNQQRNTPIDPSAFQPPAVERTP